MRVIQFGNGVWGQNHRRILEGSDRVKFCGMFDIDDYYSDVLSEQLPDAVVITCSSVNHMEIASECIERGIPVYCEKPICVKR